MNLLEELQRQKKEMVEYLKLKMFIEDWHGCQDAASDIREIEAKIALLRSLEYEKNNSGTVLGSSDQNK